MPRLPGLTEIIGQNLDTGEQVALKLEHRLQEPLLDYEVEWYKVLGDLPGFPSLYWYGSQDDYQVMVLELLGPTLDDLFEFCDCRFSLKTAVMIMDQLLSRFEALHSKGFLHRDVKPPNCLLGLGKNGNTVYLADFGVSTEFRVTLDEEEEPSPPARPGLIGTIRFASIKGHSGQGTCLH
jgi:serine/threonine protein kinase